jgi:molybdate transport system substrate-binding protein
MPPVIRTRKVILICSALIAATGLGACAADTASTSASPGPTTSASATASATDTSAATDTASPAATPAAAISGKLTVLAASSLTEVFNKLGEKFKAEHPDVSIEFSYGGSPDLAQQIVSKAPADVFAAASPATMKTVTDAGDAVGAPQTFVRNTLEIAVPVDNPGHVAGLADFAKSDLKIVLCAVEVPCGAAADKVLKSANIKASVDSYEPNVKSVLTKITTGEADAGLVYRTDVKSDGDKVTGIDFPESAKAINDYPIVALNTGSNSAAAAAWVAFVTGPEARQILTDFGFQTP